MKNHNQPFLAKLAGSGLNENYVSRAFQACFLESNIFAKCMLNAVWRHCQLPGRPPDSNDWTCDYQPHTPYSNKDRPDLRLRLRSDAGRRSYARSIYIESKIGSRLSEEQLQRYKDSGGHTLIALTKNWPEVPIRRLRELKINIVRWQDIARELDQTKIRSPRENFLCKAFQELLEYAGMTYREDLNVSEMERVRRLLNTIGSDEFSPVVPQGAFALADNTLSFLGDVKKFALDLGGSTERWHSWGPGYYHDLSEEGETLWHALGFLIHPPHQYSKSRLLCGLYFPTDPEANIFYRVGRRGSLIDNHESDRKLSGILSNDKLDAEKLARKLIAYGRKSELI